MVNWAKFRRPGADAVPVAASDAAPKSDHPVDKEAAVVGDHTNAGSDAETDAEAVSIDVQAGIQASEATTLVWTKTSLVTAYILIWVITFIDALQQGMAGSLTFYVTSSFAQLPLTATTSIMSSIIGGLIKLPLAKILDIWGRPQGFAVSVLLLIIGLIMMAACQNVETYAAAQVFYWVGYNGSNYALSVFVADTSKLKNRSLMFAFTSSPYIITVWCSGPLATAYLDGPGWAWGFGTFAIVTPFICGPLFFLFYWNYLKAKKAGLMPRRESGRTLVQSLKYYAIEFDVIGILLIAAGLALFLLPFNIYSFQSDGWHSPLIICFIIFGGLLLIAFALYEKYLAPVTFIPFHLLLDRTVLGGCILSAVLFVSFYIWDSYFFTFLQVVNDLDVTQATYVTNIYSIGSCFWSFVVGYAIRVTGRFKWIALYFGVPLTILGVGLMIQFRQPDVNIGYIVMCQIFIAFSGGALVITEQMAVMAATSHQYIAVVLAIEAMFANIGGAIGSTIASAIWTGVFPDRLREYLPEETQDQFDLIYGDVTAQLSYPVGDPTRTAIQRAYGDSQRLMLIASTAMLVIAVVSVAVWRDIKVKDFKQVKGTVI